MAHYTISKTFTNKEPRFCARVREVVGKRTVFSRARTFTHKKAALLWAQDLVKKLDYEAAGISLGSCEATVEQLITDYMKYKALSKRPLGRSSIFCYQTIQKTQFAKKLVSRLTSRDIIDFALERQASSTSPGPVTIAVDISHIRKLLRIAKPMFDVPADEKSVVGAYQSLRDLGLIARSSQRSRRLKKGEYDQITEALKRKELAAHCKTPYADLFLLSILTCCRIGELCNIHWTDIDFSNNTLLVRDRKNPNGSKGNHSVIPLLGDAPQLLEKQPKTDSRVFPINPKSVTTGFRRSLKAIGISDLRYHDLRREGATRLIEMGYSVEETAMVTGHRDLKILWQVYISIDPARLVKKRSQEKI